MRREIFADYFAVPLNHSNDRPGQVYYGVERLTIKEQDWTIDVQLEEMSVVDSWVKYRVSITDRRVPNKPAELSFGLPTVTLLMLDGPDPGENKIPLHALCCQTERRAISVLLGLVFSSLVGANALAYAELVVLTNYLNMSPGGALDIIVSDTTTVRMTYVVLHDDTVQIARIVKTTALSPTVRQTEMMDARALWPTTAVVNGSGLRKFAEALIGLTDTGYITYSMGELADSYEAKQVPEAVCGAYKELKWVGDIEQLARSLNHLKLADFTHAYIGLHDALFVGKIIVLFPEA